MTTMRHGFHLLLLATSVLSSVSIGCSTTISGERQESIPGADANGPSDATPIAFTDAKPQAAPCVEGDVQLSDPDGTCYMFFASPSSWPASQDACIALGGSLITVLDAADQALASQLAVNADLATPDLWLGASDQQLENSFVWVDGTVLTFNVWRLGEPNNGGAAGLPENCVVIEGDNPAFEWDDRPCDRLQPYICERAP